MANHIKNKDLELLNELEELYACEAKLINRINNLEHHKEQIFFKESINKNNPLKTKLSSLNLSNLMIEWSNRIVFIVLIGISVIGLTKQAWG